LQLKLTTIKHLKTPISIVVFSQNILHQYPYVAIFLVRD
jgi:hypothetical protein